MQNPINTCASLAWSAASRASLTATISTPGTTALNSARRSSLSILSKTFFGGAQPGRSRDGIPDSRIPSSSISTWTAAERRRSFSSARESAWVKAGKTLMNRAISKDFLLIGFIRSVHPGFSRFLCANRHPACARPSPAYCLLRGVAWSCRESARWQPGGR